MNKENDNIEKALDAINNNLEEFIRPLIKVIQLLNDNTESPKALKVCFDVFVSHVYETAFIKLLNTISQHRDHKFKEEFKKLIKPEEFEIIKKFNQEYEEFKRGMN